MNVLFKDMLAKTESVLADFNPAPAQATVPLDASDAASFIDHTLLKRDSSAGDIDRLIEDAGKHPFASVCVPPYWLQRLVQKAPKDARKCTVIAFPNGNQTLKTKISETKEMVRGGADELDCVINLSALKNENYQETFNEILKIRRACQGLLLKVILETCMLTPKEICMACLIAKEAEVDFVKTSTGFAEKGADKNTVALMRTCVGDQIGR